MTIELDCSTYFCNDNSAAKSVAMTVQNDNYYLLFTESGGSRVKVKISKEQVNHLRQAAERLL